MSYTIEYSSYRADAGEALFKKQQRGVLIGRVARGWSRLDSTASNITKREFDTVFNLDSMGDEEFLKYNRSELHAIAVGRDVMKKEWLKKYLDTCGGSSIKRELLSLLR